MITSAHNAKIQRVRALASRRQEREQQGAFVVEGVRLVEEALTSGWQIELVLHASGLSDRGQSLLERFRAGGTEVEEVPPHLLQSTADTETSQGLLAVVLSRSLALPTDLSFLLVADAVRDPGNLGTLLRTAAAAGTDAAILAPGTVDAFSPKVLRAGMGAHFRLPVLSMTWNEITAVCKNRLNTSALNIYVAEAEEGTPCWSLDLRPPLALVVGGEAEGATSSARQSADGFVTIPMPGQSESLNAAVAASILMFEVVRQRTEKSNE
jgi:RNA methyltransferase, TrmH family